MADFGCDLVECRGDRGQRCHEVSMAVALNHLRGDRGGFQSQTGADLLFEFRREMGKRSDGARELANAQIFRGGTKARDVTLSLRIPVGDLESKSDGFGVDAVGTPDHRRIFELERPRSEEHTSELQSHSDLVCRLLLEKKKKK